MVREARMESETGFYHVMVRGINKEKILEKEKEKERILMLIKEKRQDVLCRIVAYCVMDNHMHMIIIAEKSELVKIMKKINISYAMSYNQRHDRVGPVFQGRFRSENITDEAYLYGAIRYIHNNPIKAGLVSKPEEYKWSSLREYLNDTPIIIDEKIKEEILNGFVSAKDFLDFHRIEDDTNYLEIKEEAEQLKEKKAKRIINNYFEEKRITDKGQVKGKDMEELLKKLLNETDLSYRKIADLTGTNLRIIHKVNKTLRNNLYRSPYSSP